MRRLICNVFSFMKILQEFNFFTGVQFFMGYFRNIFLNSHGLKLRDFHRTVKIHNPSS